MIWGDAIVILVTLSVMAIIISPSFFMFRESNLKILPVAGAFAIGTLTVCCGLPLVSMGFAIDRIDRFGFQISIFAIAGTVGGVPGALAGYVVALLIERRSYSRTAKPVDTAVKRVDTEAKPPDTAVQRIDKRDPEH
jgi:hypothetical protein